MNENNEQISNLLEQLEPLALPPAKYPPAIIVRDTERERLVKRIEENAQLVGIELNDDHWEVIHFLFDFYINCCEQKDPGYLGQKTYWKYIDCLRDPDCRKTLDNANTTDCRYGKISAKEAIKAYPVYRILLKAFKHKGGKKHLYKLFPYGPLFTIHLLAQLPRLINDVNPHYGTAY